MQGNHFIIRTDHQGLKHLLDQKSTSALPHKWVSKLLGLHYEIVYKKGFENQAADALSRKRPGETKINVISHIIPQWISDVQESYTKDLKAQEKIAAKLLDQTTNPDYSYINGILRYKGRLYIGDEVAIKQLIIKHIHDLAIGGHSGMQGSYKRAKSVFYWNGMKNDVFVYVQACDI